VSSVKVQGSGGQGCDLELDEGERERSGKVGSKPMDRERSLSASVNVLCLAIISTVGDKLHKGVAKLAVKHPIREINQRNKSKLSKANQSQKV